MILKIMSLFDITINFCNQIENILMISMGQYSRFREETNNLIVTYVGVDVKYIVYVCILWRKSLH